MRDKRKQLEKLNTYTNHYIIFDTFGNKTFAFLFEETKDIGIKIAKSIDIISNKLDEIANQLIEESNKYNNCKIIIPNLVSRIGILDYFYEKDFTDIIEINKEDARESITNNIGIVQNKEKLYKIFVCDNVDSKYIQLIQDIYNELNNLEIKVNDSQNINFKRKNDDIDNSQINLVFWILSKLGIRL